MTTEALLNLVTAQSKKQTVWESIDSLTCFSFACPSQKLSKHMVFGGIEWADGIPHTKTKPDAMPM